MIIFGSRASVIATKNISGNCSSCGTPNSMQMSIIQKYAHVFWIPFFPIWKTGVTECSHCKHVLLKKEFSGNLIATYETVKANSKTPLWNFSGLFILTAIIVWGVISNQQNTAKNEQLLLAPQQGDIYEIKLAYKQYTLYKVDHIVDDTVFLLINEYEANKKRLLSDLKKKGGAAYSEDIYPFLKTELKTMLEKGEIIDIDRK